MNNFIFAQIYGTDSDDNIVNDRDNVTINALAGNDTVDNIGSNVAVYGGTGNDSLHNNGSDYSSRISNITLDGGDGNDYISNNSYTSNVLINGGNGRDYIWNYANNVTINAGADNDYIYNGGDTVSIGGDDSNDTINNSYGNNVTIDGGIGSDIVSISSSTSVTAFGGYGDDTIVIDRSNNLFVNGGAGNDSINIAGANDNVNTIAGGEGDDTITGGRGLHLYQYTSGDGNDLITDFNANDTLQIGDGTGTYSTVVSGNNLIVNVGNGSVTLTGAASLSTVNIIGPCIIENTIDNVYIAGTSDADTIINRGYNVTIQALGGDDYIDNSGDNVFVSGGAGNDYIINGSSSGPYVHQSYTTILSGDGNDTVYNNYNGDYSLIDGGAGDDSIYSSDEDNSTINGGEGNDTIQGKYWGSSLNGDNGNDLINVLGGGYYNSINGGDGDDTISNNANYALIDGGSGNDSISNSGNNVTIQALGGGDTILNGEYADNVSIDGGNGNDEIQNGSANVSINSGDGNDYIFNYGDSVLVYGGVGDDSISNESGSNLIIDGGVGNDSIENAGGSNISINTGDGNDFIYNDGENSSIYGGEGNDTIINDGTNAYINGGTGNDLISLGSYASNNLIQYTSDDGNDIINGFNETSTLQIGNGTGTYSKQTSGNDVIITVGDGSVTLKGAAGLSAVNIAGTYVDPLLIVGTDKADNISKDLDNATIQALGGNDTIINGGNDTIINGGNDVLIYGGDGNDLITNSGTNTYITDGAGNDTIQNSGVAYINLTAGNDYVINSGQNTASTVQVDADATGKKVINLSDVGDFVVVDEAAARNNSVNIISGAGNDSIFVRNDVKTTIDMSKGGVDVVSTWGGANARVTLDNYDAATGAGIKVDELGASVVAEAIDNGTIVLNNGNVEINGTDGTSEFEIGQDATGGTIVNLIGAFGDNKALVGFTGKKGGAVDVSTFTNDAILIGNMDGKKSKGSTLTGGAGNDRIYVGKNDVVNAGAGNDTISNSGGKLLIQYSEGDGDDSIIGFDSKSTLQIGDGTGTYSSVASNSDVVITVGDGSVTLKGAANLSTVTIAGTEILPGPKTLYLDDSDKSPVTLSSDYQHADASARVKKAIKIAGNEQDNSIIGGDKNDSLVGKDGNDTLIGGLGNDTFIGGNGNDVFVYIAGNDVVTDYVSGQDTIKFESAITNASGKGNDVIFITDDGKITVKNSKGKTINYIDLNGKLSVYPDTIEGGKPTVCVSLNSAKTAAEIFECYNKDIFYAPEWGTRIKSIDASATTHDLEIIGNETVASKIIGGDGDNILYGSTKNDTFTGGVGNDTFVYSGGNDTITDYTEDEDIIDIESGASYDKASVKGNDVIFTFGKNKITVKDAADKVITFSDGTTWDGGGGSRVITLTNSDPSPYILGAKIETFDGTKRTKAIEIFGNDLDNSIVSGSKNDSIYGGDGDDTLNGAKGNDTLTGGEGYDLFIYTAGKDVITDYNEDEDIISLAAGTIKTASVKGSDVVFKIGSGTLTVNDAAGKTLSMIDANGNEFSTVVGGGVDTLKIVTNDDPSPVTLAFEVEVVDATKRTKYDVTIEGNAQNNSIVGGSKHDSIYGAAGDDTLNGGKGNDTLTGGDGNDVFVYTAGKDVITDYETGDKISTGTIKNASAEGDDVVFKIGSGTLTVNDAAGKTLNMIDANGNEYSMIIGGSKETVSLNAAGTAVEIFEGYTADSFDAADYGSKLKTIDASATTHDFEIIGNGLANSIIGGSGDNILIGGLGNDKLWGNEGNDTFLYSDGDGKDVIFGFEDGDLLQITGDFSASFNAKKNEIAFKVGTTSNAITLKEFDATIFNINGDSYQISGTQLVKK